MQNIDKNWNYIDQTDRNGRFLNWENWWTFLTNIKNNCANSNVYIITTRTNSVALLLCSKLQKWWWQLKWQKCQNLCQFVDQIDWMWLCHNWRIHGNFKRNPQKMGPLYISTKPTLCRCMGQLECFCIYRNVILDGHSIHRLLKLWNWTHWNAKNNPKLYHLWLITLTLWYPDFWKSKILPNNIQKKTCDNSNVEKLINRFTCQKDWLGQVQNSQNCCKLYITTKNKKANGKCHKFDTSDDVLFKLNEFDLTTIWMQGIDNHFKQKSTKMVSNLNGKSK